jgi:hypothetical protein
MMYKCSFISFENQGNEDELLLPEGIYHKFDVSRQLILRAGASSLNVTCLPSGRGDSQITLKTGHRLFSSIPQSENMLVKLDPANNSLSIGPMTALLLDHCHEDKLNTHSLKEYFTECQKWFQLKGGLFYLLPVTSLLKNSSEAWIFNQREWQKKTMLLPNVIYNRSHSRKLETHPLYESALKRTEDHSVHLFNSSFLSKDIVYMHLRNSKPLHPHLPETVQGIERIDEMLSIYKDVFVKAVNGSKGRYILRVQKRADDYLVYQNSFSSKRTLTFPNYSSLYKQLQSWCSGSHYIVQQTIPFMSVNEQPLDFRILCHKKYEGAWSVISSVGRIASEKQFVANIDQGGHIESPLSILSSLFSPDDGKVIFEKMKALALSASSFLSQHLDGQYAEFGIDIGIDCDGKPWIIEINSKPSKRTLVDIERFRPSVKAMYEYSYNIWKNKED